MVLCLPPFITSIVSQPGSEFESALTISCIYRLSALRPTLPISLLFSVTTLRSTRKPDSHRVASWSISVFCRLCISCCLVNISIPSVFAAIIPYPLLWHSGPLPYLRHIHPVRQTKATLVVFSPSFRYHIKPTWPGPRPSALDLDTQDTSLTETRADVPTPPFCLRIHALLIFPTCVPHPLPVS